MIAFIVELSFVLFIAESMVRNLDETAENAPPPQQRSARAQSSPIPVGISPGIAGRVETDEIVDTVDHPELSRQAPSPASDQSLDLPTHLEQLAGRALEYVEAASSPNTRRAYESDWRHFSSWCRRQGLQKTHQIPRLPGCIWLLAPQALRREAESPPLFPASNGACQPLPGITGSPDKSSTEQTGISPRCSPASETPTHNRRFRKEAVLPKDILAMLETLDRGSLRGLRDRAMLPIGFAGGLRRSEITGLDAGREQTQDGRGWVDILDKGMIVTLRGKTGWREVEIGRGSSDSTCPVSSLETWLKFGKIAHGPLFRRVTGEVKPVGTNRLNDQEVARLVKRAAMAAGVRGDLSEPKGRRVLPDTHCAQAWPVRPWWMSDMCRSNWDTPRRK